MGLVGFGWVWLGWVWLGWVGLGKVIIKQWLVTPRLFARLAQYSHECSEVTHIFFQKCPFVNGGKSGKSLQKCLANDCESGKSSQKCLSNVGKYLPKCLANVSASMHNKIGHFMYK